MMRTQDKMKIIKHVIEVRINKIFCTEFTVIVNMKHDRQMIFNRLDILIHRIHS